MIVLDTSVISYIFKGDSRGDYYKDRIRGERCVVSFQTLEEVQFGALRNSWGQRRKNELELHLQQYEVIWPNQELVERCAYLRSEREGVGRSLAMADALDRWDRTSARLPTSCP